MLLLACGCQRQQAVQEETPPATLSIYVYPSGQPMLTRADVGLVEAYDQEKIVHELQIWIYSHASGDLLLYLSPERNSLQSGEAERFQVHLESSEEAKFRNAQVDVYVLANGSSIGSSLSDNSSRDEVRNLTIGGSYFSTSPLTDDIAASGLPMSGYAEDVSVAGSNPLYSIPVVRLKRCVSKLRFVFAQPPSPAFDFQVTGIQLNGNLIPNTEQVFTTAAYSISSSYASAPFTVAAPSSVAECSSVTSLIYQSGQDAQDYETLVDAAVKAGEATQAGPFYLRESDKPLSGTLTYTVNGVQKTAPFAMDSEPGAYNFSRNHTWTVYAYFSGGRLYVCPTVYPWEAGHDRFDYATQGSTILEWKSYLRYDEDQNSSTWGDTYLAVAMGYDSGTDIPNRSPLLTLRTTNVNNLRLAVNNEKFQLIVLKNDTYEKWGQEYIIEGDDDEQTTYFYVVPTEENPVDKFTNVTVTAIPTDGMPPFHIPFNHDLPGEEDHTTIRVKNVGSATYQANMANEKVSGSAQSSQYWLEKNE